MCGMCWGGKGRQDVCRGEVVTDLKNPRVHKNYTSRTVDGWVGAHLYAKHVVEVMCSSYKSSVK